MKYKLTSFLLLAITAIEGQQAAERATPAEAKAMLNQAIAHYLTVGRKRAFADFTARKSPFAERDLYVVCFTRDHRVVANGGFPLHVGTSGDAVKDVSGKGVATAGWDAANGEGVVHYRWINPMTQKLETKIAFFAKAGDDVCGVGAYSPH